MHAQETQRFNRFESLVSIGIIICLILQLYLQFTQKINWDEFHFLSQIYAFQRGELGVPLQTFHVHLFAWLPLLAMTEIEQIIVARIVMWVLEIGTLVFIYSVARAFVSRTGALISALAYISSNMVLVHGTSFRTDPIAVCAIMFCLYVLVRSQLSFKSLAGFAIAAAGAALITIKIVFFAPALIGVGLWRMKNSDQPKRLLAKLTVTAVATIVLMALFYWYQLSTMPLASTEAAGSGVSSAFTTTLLSQGLFPRLGAILAGLIGSPMQSLALLAGICFAIYGVIRGKVASQKQTATMLLVLATPLLALVFYRNAFPYFFAFIFPPSMVLVGFFADRIKAMHLVVSSMCIVMVLGATYFTFKRSAENLTVQRETVRAVHQIFEHPVNYIDRSSMISSFPKQGFFMTSWGYQNYIRAEQPIYARILTDKTTPLLIINSPLFDHALLKIPPVPDRRLFDEDISVLRENYIPHWGHLWVAGKVLEPGPLPQSFSLLTPGIYTVEADMPVTIDGEIYLPGATIDLARDVHTVTAQEPTDLTLRWGDHLHIPQTSASVDPIFTGF